MKRAEQEVKVYLCLFTCATTCTIHLEIVQDLSTETFLLAFRKFAGQWSLPKLMISDNGSTYMSAAEELHSLMEKTEVKEGEASLGSSYPREPSGMVASSGAHKNHH